MRTSELEEDTDTVHQYKMMQPSLPAAPKAISSIYDAIKDGDWEGLLSLYATTTYDAVHSEDFARRGVSVGVHHQEQPLLPTLMTGSNDNTNGLFHEGMSIAIAISIFEILVCNIV